MNATPESTYSRQRSQSWTRVDMLLSLYRSGISSLDAAIETIGTNPEESFRHRSKARRVVFGIAAGLDMRNEIAIQIARLCDYCQHAIEEDSVESLISVRQVLTTLRSAFEEIREDAVRLERNGVIPRIDLDSTVEIAV